jgi:hypothetical protein
MSVTAMSPATSIEMRKFECRVRYRGISSAVRFSTR